MKRNFAIYIRDILDNMENICSFTENLSYEAFADDKKVHYAVVRCLEIIGEAAKNVPEDIRNRHPDIPWKEMAGMRDKVIHSYFGVDLKKVWLVVQDDIPRLRPGFQKILNELKG
jgi:uncharacterized protein with HEPN domain